MTAPRLPIKTTAERMHQAYCAEMGYDPDDVPLTMGSHFAWQLFADAFTTDDLRTLIRHIRKKGRMARSLQARHLITGPCSIEFAHEDLAEAKAMNRVRPITPREKILAATGRPTEQPTHLTTPARVMDGANKTKEEWAAFFEKCRKEAGI